MRDPIRSGIAEGWKAYDASTFEAARTFEADVAIVGTGAGGGTAAEILADAGLRVLMVEEGPLQSSSDFHMFEREAYPALYQESAARKTKDGGINILQGRAVGGSTTVNWTSSFRTPPSTLAFWRERFGLADYTEHALAPWFADREAKLHVRTWREPPNANNDVLRAGAAALGIATAIVPRNVNGCWNLGYCGMGCPTNAKQSMLVTTIPAALARGAVLLSRTRAQRLVADPHGTIRTLECDAMDHGGIRPTGCRITVRARHFVLAGGGIGTPALLLRSNVADPFARVGKRTFLHPTVISAAVMPHRIDPFAGAPQSVYSDHFLKEHAIDGPVGYKLEVPPLHPVLTATTMTAFGIEQARVMERFRKTSAIIALLRDGFNEQSQGGHVELKSDGSPLLDYPIGSYLWEGARRAFDTMARIQFAAGARSVFPLHESAVPYRTLREARRAIASLSMEVLRTRVASAHVMGGCAMGSDPASAVVDGNGGHHHCANLSIFDGSVFPTSVGANPQLSIYAIVARNATRLAAILS